MYLVIAPLMQVLFFVFGFALALLLCMFNPFRELLMKWSKAIFISEAKVEPDMTLEELEAKAKEESHFDKSSLFEDLEKILEQVRFGILYYRADGRLRYANSVIESMIGTKPESTTDLLAALGAHGDLHAVLLLQEGQRETIVKDGDRILNLSIRDVTDAVNGLRSTLILVQDITEREAIENQRKQFVANVSHELKTPLTTIKMYSESLLDWGIEEKSRPAIHKDVERLYQDALRMEQLVSDLLLLSSIDSKGKRYHFSEIDIAAIGHSVVERMKAEAERRQIHLRFVQMHQIPTVLGDQDSIERILTNLITNALKYSDANTEVVVYLSCPLEDVNIKVVDQGYGIAAQHIPHLFERFYRVDVTGSRHYGGTGLGLSIAKELAELHHGTIKVTSRLGKGSEFLVAIPTAERSFRQAFDYKVHDRGEGDLLWDYAAYELYMMSQDYEMNVTDLSQLKSEQLERLMQAYQLRPNESRGEAQRQDRRA